MTFSAKDRRAPVAIAIVVLQAALLLKYFTTTGTAIGPTRWLHSFEFGEGAGPFELARFFGILFVSLSSLLAYVGWVAVCWIAGTLALSPFKSLEMDFSERALSALGLGLGLLSLILFFLGLFYLYYPATPYVTALAMLAISAVYVRRNPRPLGSAIVPTFSDLRGKVRSPWSSRSGKGEKYDFEQMAVGLVGIICAVTLLFHLLGALLPPASFDEMNYQLAIPKLYTLNHGIISTPFNHLSYLPRNMNMLFTLGLMEGSPIISKLFSWGMGVLAVLTVYVLGRPLIGKKSAFIAASIFFLTPVIGNQFRVAGTDLGVAFYELLGILWLLRAIQQEKISHAMILLSSIFWGLALGTKYTAIPGFTAGFLLLCWMLYFSGRIDLYEASSRRRKGSSGPGSSSGRIGLLAIFIVPALLLWSPWLLLNWSNSGNPFNPMFSTIIPSRNFFFAGSYKPLVDYAVGLGIPHYFPISSVRDLLRMPWRVLTEYNDFNHDMGAAWLLCAPLLLVAWRKPMPRAIRPISALCALYWAFWFLSKVRMARYFVTGIALTSLLAGSLVESAGSINASLLMIPFLFVFLLQSMRMVYIQNVYKSPWGYLAGRMSLKGYLETVQPNFPYDAYELVNKTLPADATVLVFNEFRTFYLDRNFIASTPWDHDPWHEIVHTSSSLDDIGGKLRAMNVSFMLVNEDYVLHQSGSRLAPGWSKEDWLKSLHFWKHGTKRLFFDEEGAWLAAISPQVTPPAGNVSLETEPSPLLNRKQSVTLNFLTDHK